MPAIQQQRTNIKNAGGSARKIIGKFNSLILGEVHTAGNNVRRASPKTPIAALLKPCIRHRTVQLESARASPFFSRARPGSVACVNTREIRGPTQNIRPETPRSRQAWCHVVTNFAESSVISTDYGNQVFK